MKIHSNPSIPAAAGGRAQGSPAERSRTETGNPETDNTSATGDRLSLTSTAQHLQELGARIEGQPRVDRQRVEAMKEALKNGTLTVDPERIAERLIGLEQALTSQR